MSTWPRFTKPLASAESGQPEPYVSQFLDEVTAEIGRKRSLIRVLDVGCGRGDRVAWLLSEGWDAYGADVQYVEQGCRWLDDEGYGPRRLRLIDDYRLPFDDIAPFDIILSYQVLEHIPDIDAFTAGIAAVSRQGTIGLHACPAAWRPVEPHMHAPLVHWVPKGPLRKHAIKTALRLGWTNDHFADLSLDERTEHYNHFSETETFYRSRRTLREAFARRDQRAEFDEVTTAKLRVRLPSLDRIPPHLVVPLAKVYGTFGSCYVKTTQQQDLTGSPGAK